MMDRGGNDLEMTVGNLQETIENAADNGLEEHFMVRLDSYYPGKAKLL